MAANKSPFRYLSSINGKITIPVESDYNQFLLSRGMSLHLDTALLANEINKYPGITDQMHYDFFTSTVKPKKRFSKWPKPATSKQAQLISKFYQISMQQAYQYVPFFDENEIEQISEYLNQREDK